MVFTMPNSGWAFAS